MRLRRAPSASGGRGSSGFTLELAAVADSVPLVRRAVRELLEAAFVTPERIADIGLAVTEACANAVVHAYPDQSGVFAVHAALTPASLVVTVRDHGSGMTARPDSPGLGVGLPVMAAIADTLEIDTPSDTGPIVRMTFGL